MRASTEMRPAAGGAPTSSPESRGVRRAARPSSAAPPGPDPDPAWRRVNRTGRRPRFCWSASSAAPAAVKRRTVEGISYSTAETAPPPAAPGRAAATGANCRAPSPPARPSGAAKPADAVTV